MTLCVQCAVFATLPSPIVGFQVRDRLGQVIFGDNTYLALLGDPVKADAGSSITASFDFAVPVLPMGDYTVRSPLPTAPRMNTSNVTGSMTRSASSPLK
jgi:lipopolysaccharide transport system ATP-binding protein